MVRVEGEKRLVGSGREREYYVLVFYLTQDAENPNDGDRLMGVKAMFNHIWLQVELYRTKYIHVALPVVVSLGVIVVLETSTSVI